MNLPYSYQSHGRKPTTALIVLAIWAVLLAAFVWIEASALLMVLIALFTLPAVFDLIINPRSSLRLDPEYLRWESGRQSAQIALSEIDYLRFDTRLDLSVRLSVIRPSGVKIRVPFPATPPHAEFEQVAQAAGLKTQRHHFSLIS